MDYDEQHRICEQEFELDDTYTVAMDAMPEHWKEEADAQLTYLRNMHICSSSMLLLAVLICFSLLDEAGFPFEIDGGIPFQPSGSSFGLFRAANHSTLEAWITISIWKRTLEVRFLCYRYSQNRKYVLSVF